MKILVTGVFGFLGLNLANKLSENHEVVGLYNQNFHEINSNIRVFSDHRSLPFVPDQIILCHASVASGNTQVPLDLLFKSNVAFTHEIMEHFKGVRIVYISSVSVYGISDNTITEVSNEKPVTDYALSKLWGEKIVLKDKKNCVIRLSSLYGEGMKENTLLPNYVNQALANSSIQVWGNGSRFQNYIHVKDAVNLIEKSLHLEEDIDFPLLGVSGIEYPNNEVASIISGFTEADIEYVKEDKSPSVRFENTLTKNLLKWSHQVDLEVGLKNYIQWKKKQY